MTVIGLDDTDSRERGMCTTYLAARLAEAVQAAGAAVTRTLLVRLNPAVEHKTRGNAALAVHAEIGPDRALGLAREAVEQAATGDPETNPGVVVADCDPDAVPLSVAGFARGAVRGVRSPATARSLADRAGWSTVERGTGRGVVGALAAVGAWRAGGGTGVDRKGDPADRGWTHESIAYRERQRWGTERRVDRDSVFAAAEASYPAVWDTVDRVERAAVCVPRTPCPVLYGIRGDDPGTVEDVAARIGDADGTEPVARRHTFVTNQGTDAHLRTARVGAVREGRAYRVTGEVVDPPTTREGGHVFLTIRGKAGGTDLRCVAFEPTKRFRDRVRALRVGDRITVCGEVDDGTLKLEKFAARELVRTEATTPDCPDCGRSMASAGRDQGYRCRDCGRRADGKVRRAIDREIEAGWYEVPPVARRHVAKPLVRGGFDAPTHPER
ncbi:MAG: DUF1743 domain-containing protein [Salinirussus sp.]